MSPLMPAPDFGHTRVTTAIGERSGLVMTVALHSDALGPALGGCRLWQYETWTDSVHDALRLSSAMTLKNAVAGLEAGGGKSVIAVPTGTVLDAGRRRKALLDLGDLVESFGGRYRTAEDVGTTAEDMSVVRERTEHVVGLPSALGGTGEPAVPTSIGVYASILATIARVTGSRRIEGTRITISGLGQVGSRLAIQLASANAELTVTDVNPVKRAIAESLGARWVEPERAHEVDADLFVPAGIGGVLTAEIIDGLGSRAVVGPANNPLADRSGADRLAGRGILYAPDFVVNAGGVLYLDLMGRPNADEARVMERVRGIGETLESLFETADDLGITPLEAAENLAAERLSLARSPRVENTPVLA